MQKLIEGVEKFRSQIYNQRREFFQRLSKGQTPEALFITCSDSRVNPNLITQTQPGDLFIVRNAGNIVPPYGAASGGEAATIEYAVAVLGVRDIILCGHSHCGAMQALLRPETLSELTTIERWMANADATRRIIKDGYSHLEGEELLMKTVQANVLVQLEHLRTLPTVASALVRRRLRLHGWIYMIETGEVQVYAPEQRRFVPVTERPIPDLKINEEEEPELLL